MSYISPAFPPGSKGKLLMALAALLMLSLFGWRVADTISGNSPTFDESVHVTRGYAALKLHDLRLNVEHPVLGDALAASPLLLDPSIRFPSGSVAWQAASHWVVSDLFIWHDNSHSQLLIERARYAVLTMAILLGLVVAAWAAELYGWAGGLLALLLYTVCPNILANSGLATNDLSLTFFSTLFLWLLWRFVGKPTFLRGLFSSIALAAAVMCKYSGLVLCAETVLLLFWWWWATRRGRKAARELPGVHGDYVAPSNGSTVPILSNGFTSTGLAAQEGRRRALSGSFLRTFFGAMGILFGAALCVWGVYGLKVEPIATPAVMQQDVGRSLDQFIRRHEPQPDDHLIALPEEVLAPVPPLPQNMRERILTRYKLPAPQYLRGLIQTYMQLRGGHRAYLLGKVSRKGWWYFFPVAFVLKTPLPFLLLITLALLTVTEGWEWDEWFLLLPVAALLAGAMRSHIDIGIRHLLPLYPLLAIFCGRLAPAVSAYAGDRLRLQRAAAIFVGLLCAWSLAESAAIHPLYLTYFNEMAGGPDGGAHYLVDSSLDWGQDLLRLKREIQRRHIGPIALAYFGTAEPSAYGIEYIPLDTAPLLGPAPTKPPLYGWMAASVSDLAYYGGKGGGLSWLRNYRPEFTVAHTIRVYHIPMPSVQRPEAHSLSKAVPVNWP
ncbi:MAG: glycosyltransferase family 39 protein [Armatimonadota bacterium]|nr:glycosyltransferase family 39 protein [Armatimonadota bacterium]